MASYCLLESKQLPDGSLETEEEVVSESLKIQPPHTQNSGKAQSPSDPLTLYYDPCSAWDRFWAPCEPAPLIYSPTLNRTFVVGHPASFWGFTPSQAVEVIDAVTTRLREPARISRFVADLPSLKGVLFKGADNEALFYDGLSLTNFFSLGSEDLASKASDHWQLKSTDSGRFFLTNIGRMNISPYLAEILVEGPRTGPSLNEFSVPAELGESWLSLFESSNDTTMWGINRHSVFVEDKSGLRKVIQVNKPAYIHGPADILARAEGGLSFSISNDLEKSMTDYAIIHPPDAKQCRQPLSDTVKTVLNDR